MTRRRLFGAAVFASSMVLACGGDTNPSTSSSDGGAGTTLSTGGTGNESGAGGDLPTSSGGAGASGTGVGGTTGGTGGATSGGSSGSSNGGASGGSSGAASGGSAGSNGGADGAVAPEPDSGSASTCAPSSDTCPMSSGLVHGCERRFALGLNYAWHNFSCDFGGLAAWNTKGVSDDPTTVDTDLAAMHAAGASVIRWWVFPRTPAPSRKLGTR